ncbi:MAG: peptidoglycan-binding protein [Oscillospiraceae bacterium]|nr:peptidoglycan-binding protein [Oscillospiraceae bacterium]
MSENMFISNPIMSIQSILRVILFYDGDDTTALIPDGIYGPETKRAVENFQKDYGMEENGIINFETWQKIIEVYRKTINRYSPPTGAIIYPSAECIIKPADKTPCLSVIQVMMNSIADRYKNIPKNEMNCIHDETSVNSVEALQKIFNMEKNGTINKDFWENLTRLYEVAVTRNFMLDN